MDNKSTLIIKNCTIFTPKDLLRHYDILVVNKRIERIGKNINSERNDQITILEAKEMLVSPGLIDSHTHGSYGIDFMTASVGQIQQLLKLYAENGVTSVLPTLSPALQDDYYRCCDLISEVLKKGEAGACILGIHLEGPYINQEQKGAQPGVDGHTPGLNEIKKFIKCSGNPVKIVTLAPEIPGGLQLIDFLTENGIVVSVGHSNATFEETEEAIKHGLSCSTHTFNGMSGLHHRKPGVVGAVMVHDEIYAQIILDGVHVHPGAAKILFQSKGLDKIVLITDSNHTAGLGDGEFIRPGNRKVFVKDGVARLESGKLAGSVLTMNKAVLNARNFLEISLPQAIQMASLNVAKSIGINNLGAVCEGYQADMIVHDENMNIFHTIIAGEIIYSRQLSKKANEH